jgi:hypothetical protein
VSELTRLTVNLTPDTVAALATLAQRYDGKTEAVRRALRLALFTLKLEDAGGALLVRRRPGAELERVVIL